MANITNFPNGVSSFGVTLPGVLPVTFGNYYFVDYDNGSDGNDGLSMTTPLKTVAAAYALTTDNHNDVIVLAAGSGHNLTSMLTVSKNKVHFIGTSVGYKKYGMRTRITMGVTTAATDVFMVKNIGTGNSFTNIKLDCENTNVNTIGAVGEGGQYASYSNCEFYSGINLSSDTYAELVLNGDSPQFFNCTLGSIADAVVGKVRPAVITTGGAISSAYSGGVSRDVLFDGCNFWKNAGGTATAMVKITADNDLERYMEFKDCSFVANKLGSTPAVAIASAASLTKSQVNLTGSTSSANCTKLATATGIISSLPARVATATIGIQTT